MKLLRWTVAGASFYVIYKYAIGKKARGEQVFASPDGDETEAATPPAKPAPRRRKQAPKNTAASGE